MTLSVDASPTPGNERKTVRSLQKTVGVSRESSSDDPKTSSNRAQAFIPSENGHRVRHSTPVQPIRVIRSLKAFFKPKVQRSPQNLLFIHLRYRNRAQQRRSTQGPNPVLNRSTIPIRTDLGMLEMAPSGAREKNNEEPRTWRKRSNNSDGCHPCPEPDLAA